MFKTGAGLIFIGDEKLFWQMQVFSQECHKVTEDNSNGVMKTEPPLIYLLPLLNSFKQHVSQKMRSIFWGKVKFS